MKRSLLYQIGHVGGVEFDTMLEEVLLAEELGIDAVWCFPSTDGEGRFEVSAPEVWLSALASRTKSIRLGWGLSGMTPPRQAPMRVAEQGASLDLACHGRLDVGLLLEGNLGVDEEPEARAWEEGIRMLVDMWDTPAFSWTSPRFEVRRVDVLPKPEQKPHPPLWLVGWHAGHAAAAGVAGLGYLDVSGASGEGLAMSRTAYLEARGGADVHDLVCESAFAAACDFTSAVEDVQRLAEWESMGIDQAIVRAGPLEGGHLEALDRIRFLASEDTRVH